MAYLPKSQIKNINVNGELAYKESKRPYYGRAIQTSDNKYYAGANRLALGPELIINPDREDAERNKILTLAPNEKIFSAVSSTRLYNKRNIDIKNQLKNKKVIPSFKPSPVKDDYRRGFIQRYFAKRINGNNLIEISKKTFRAIKNKTGVYDHNLYEIGQLVWHIKGNDAYQKNALAIKKQQLYYKTILFLFPVLNEFLLASPNGQENLYTSGGLLYYLDGTEYIGDYHIHPSKGPMVGAQHQSSPHETLYYFNQLPQPSDQSYEDFLHNFNKIDCYKCISINNNTDIQIVSNKRSRLLGCLPNTYTTSTEAFNYCPVIEAIVDNIDRGPMVENSDNDYSLFNQTRPMIPEGGTQNIVYIDDVVSGGNGRPETQVLQTSTCFVPNTLITMADNTEKTISSIKKGDKVKSEKGESTVLDIKAHKGSFEVYSINDSKPFVTAEHPFKTIDGWKAIDPINTLEKHQISSTTLNLNDIIIKQNTKEVVKKIEKGKVKYPKVYNLMLDNEHVYYANGYLVHNEKINPVFGSSSGGGGGY